ncbi:hypothetical protein DN752_23245 [Echinicola strongylocentroti]|uniref:Uncharacterized protein n=1 Tax=Echinicola strongylocentroti TaxID=1795355 RepID=A0A2Z4INX9_9BACT|nr:hypothetical protein DN752_23245 [Echinicola strongylocentroti]
MAKEITPFQGFFMLLVFSNYKQKISANHNHLRHQRSIRTIPRSFNFSVRPGQAPTTFWVDIKEVNFVSTSGLKLDLSNHKNYEGGKHLR